MMILILAGILLILMLAVGGDRGGKSFVALVGDAAVFVACVYLIALGLNVLFVTIFGAFLFCIVTLVYQNGRNVKTWASVAAVVLDVCLVALVAFSVGRWGKIGGYSELDLNEEVSMYLSTDLRVSAQALSLAAIVFGMLGAAMDAAVSVAASVHAFHNGNPALDIRALTRAGNAVGRDILGTTVSTIFFAGIGETIMQTILFLKNGYDAAAILNSKAFLQAFSTIMISNIACLVVIPLAAILTSVLLTTDRPYIAGLRERNK